MRYRRLAAFLLVALSLVLFSLAHITRAATLLVNTSQDLATGSCATTCSLRDAISLASSGDTIVFDSAVFSTPQTILLTGGPLTIGKDLTIQGPGASFASIDGGSVSQLINIAVNTNTVTISGLTFQNGRAVSGAGIYNGGVLTINNSVITGNTATGGPGGGLANAGTLIVTNSTFSNNTATSHATYGGGGALSNAGAVTITGSTFSNNRAFDNGGVGGALFNDSNGLLTITTSTFTDNSTDFGDGGAICSNNAGTLKVSSTTFTHNIAAQNAGGAIDAAGMTTILNNTFAGNQAGGGGGALALRVGTHVVSSNTFAANQATYLGGAIYVDGGSTVLTASTFTDNSTSDPQSGGGGAISFRAYTPSEISLTIVNSTFSGNAAVYGGALSSDAYPGSGPSVTIISSTFSGNAAANGGAIYTSDYVHPNLGSTIVAGNMLTAEGTEPDVYGRVGSMGSNVIGIANNPAYTGWGGSDQIGSSASPLNPLLNSLADNGGPTQTMSLQAGSPAIQHGNCNLGSPAGPVGTDQRDMARNMPCDVGAYESDIPPTPTSTPTPTATLTMTSSVTPTPTDTLTVTASTTPALSGDPCDPSSPISRVSVDSAGAQGNLDSYDAAISADGRYVAFVSAATNLVSSDTNNANDVFVYDRSICTITRISVDSTGAQANRIAYDAAISADGRYVAFVSEATNLVSGDTNNTGDIFIHDRQTGQTTRVSVDSTSTQANAYSLAPAISADGRYVAFSSAATNLVSGDANSVGDVFIHDRQTGQTTRVSVDSMGAQPNGVSDEPAISADGRYVIFRSDATNLVSGDTNSTGDVFVHDRQTGQTTRVSVDSMGVQANGNSYFPYISADGAHVGFVSDATNLLGGDTNGVTDVFVHDMQTGQTTRVSVDSMGVQANGNSYGGALSADGRYVALGSFASNLVTSDTNNAFDVFIYDVQTGQITRVSVDSTGAQTNDNSYGITFSADGRYVAFDSDATNLVSGDTNGMDDVFVVRVNIEPVVTPTSTPSETPTASLTATSTLTITPTSTVTPTNTATATTTSTNTLPPLAAPVLVSPSNGTLTKNNMPTFTWMAVSGAESYQIQIDAQGDFSSLVQDVTLPGLSYTGTKLMDGTTYSWHVRALRNSTSQIGPWSIAWTVQIDRVRVAAPALSAPANGSNLATVTPAFSWTLVTNATQYQLQIDDDAAFGSPLIALTLGKVTTSIAKAADGLKYGATYYWRVRAGDVYSTWSDWSSSRSFTLTILKSPANGAYSTTNRPAFTWAAVSGATYTLQVAKDASFTAPLAATYTGTATAFTVPTTAPLDYGQYWWRLHLTTTTGIDAWMQPWTLTVTTPIPAAPGPLTPTVGQVMNDNTPDFTWNPTLTTAGAPFDYQIQIAKTSTFLFPIQDARQSGAINLKYTAATLADGLYYWRVRAINNSDTAGLWSAARPFTVDTTAPAMPKLVSPKDWSAISLPRPLFIWATVTGAKQYVLEIYSGSDCGTYVLTTAAQTTTSYTSAQTLTNGAYCWHVMARDAAGNAGAYSSFFHLTVSSTTIALPVAPTLVAPLNNAVLAALPAFTWTYAGTPVSQFQIQIASMSTFTAPTQDVLTTALTYTAAPLADGLYYWRVRAINSAGAGGAWSTSGKFTVASTAPAAPVLLTPVQAANLTTTRPTVTWQAATGAKSYLVQLGSDSSFNTGLVVNRTVTTTSCVLTTAEMLSYGSTYFWHVQALNAAGVGGAWSSMSQFAVTVQRTPVNGSSTTSVRPTFTWQAISGATYTLQVSTDSTFATGMAATYSGALTAYTLPASMPSLPAGLYYWRVRVITSSGNTWMPAWSLRVTPSLPGTPVLSAPANNALTGDNTPTFAWKAAINGETYQIQIDDVSTFASPNQDRTGAPGILSYTADMLPNGKYYWRVRAITSDGAAGAWSAAWTVTIDAQAPDVPVLTGPADGTNITNPQLTLRWNAAAGAAKYEVRLDTVNPPAKPPIVVGAVLAYKVAVSLSNGAYYWQVRAVDAAGNMSDWSAARSFRVVAGYTMPRQIATTTTPTPPQTPTLTLNPTPTTVPTGTPTAIPNSLQVVEAEQEGVIRTGVWTVQASSAASGGQYVFSSSGPGDALTLGFSGMTVVVVYAEHPALGTFAIEVDGQVMQTVVTTNSTTTFGTRTDIDGLKPGTHILRVYAVQGTIAIDAFSVEAIVPLSPTPVPTEAMTLEATPPPFGTLQPTIPPGVELTASATPTGITPTQMVVPTTTPTSIPMGVLPTTTSLPVHIPTMAPLSTMIPLPTAIPLRTALPSGMAGSP